MLKTLLVLISVVFFYSRDVAYAESDNEELASFMKTYISGHKDTNLLPPLFSLSAKVEGMRDGKFIKFSAQEFLERTKNVKPSKFSIRNNYQILKHNSNTAIAMANVYVEDNCFIDYLILAKLSSAWKIVYKSFSDDCTKIN